MASLTPRPGSPIGSAELPRPVKPADARSSQLPSHSCSSGHLPAAIADSRVPTPTSSLVIIGPVSGDAVARPHPGHERADPGKYVTACSLALPPPAAGGQHGERAVTSFP